MRHQPLLSRRTNPHKVHLAFRPKLSQCLHSLATGWKSFWNVVSRAQFWMKYEHIAVFDELIDDWRRCCYDVDTRPSHARCQLLAKCSQVLCYNHPQHPEEEKKQTNTAQWQLFGKVFSNALHATTTQKMWFGVVKQFRTLCQSAKQTIYKKQTNIQTNKRPNYLIKSKQINKQTPCRESVLTSNTNLC